MVIGSDRISIYPIRIRPVDRPTLESILYSYNFTKWLPNDSLMYDQHLTHTFKQKNSIAKLYNLK
ncbi:hypothetical protein HYC85_016834 [Camellia sinensis]|uniref:Uncharacterized protein n=1 Tax=Camellia sinensis TaxID=4442 RepID=A0A7J7H4E7_CAMSI|nr:hypothetical protein HYC85_016834 [Camellia sinensis]